MSIKKRLKNNSQHMPSGCIEWQGTKRNGYGRLIVGSRKDHTRRSESSHRVAYQTFVGPIPKGMWVLHKCDNPSCINPDHLFLGTRQDNVDDRERKGRNKMPNLKHEKHPNSKLNWKSVHKIRALIYVKPKELAEMFGVSRRTISDVINYKTWIPEPPKG